MKYNISIEKNGLKINTVAEDTADLGEQFKRLLEESGVKVDINDGWAANATPLWPQKE